MTIVPYLLLLCLASKIWTQKVAFHPFILNPTFLYFNDYFLLGCILKMQNHVPPLNLTVSHFHILATVLSHLSHSRYSTFTQRDSLLSRISFSLCSSKIWTEKSGLFSWFSFSLRSSKIWTQKAASRLFSCPSWTCSRWKLQRPPLFFEPNFSRF